MAKGWLIGGAVFLGILLVASIVVALAEDEEPLPPGTPQAAVQAYLKALDTEDYRTAYSYLSQELQQSCPFEYFAGQRYPGDRPSRNTRVVLDDTRIVEETAFVDVRITQFYGSGPFGTNESTFTQRFTLKMEDGQWKFSQQPWPYYGCGPFPPEPVKPAPTPAATPEPTPTATPQA